MNEIELVKQLAHAVDVGWILALWKAIHGGDPAKKDHVVEENESLDLAAIAVVARLGELYPETHKDPGASLTNLTKLGISVTATLSDDRVFELRGPEDFKRFAETFTAPNRNREQYLRKVCIQHQYIERSCKILYQVGL
ncbi:hypothetical protein WQE_34786 [Paraburkholderia hospita]|uniref:Uncharacterized protein n=1 Tax=Paraburkholderia hospita TaxID=169430 RepID=A0ABN0FCD2_9BURK|nr:hypothetical protein [Paraburkholderia hospita]EIM96299.1 hypothetical protein WQE_34786 [Paraburkholderia hospita]OUL81214.1 hypothetical protein CA602_25945 [Paraburkholderia hospita]